MDVVRSTGTILVGIRIACEVAVTSKELMMLQRLKLFSISRVFLPISISDRYVKNSREVIYRWKELRIFGVLLAMWGTIG